MKEQEIKAWADLNRLLTEYVNVYYSRKNEEKWPEKEFATLKAAFEMYHSNNMITVSPQDMIKLKICLYGIEENPYNKLVQDGAIADMKIIFKKLSGESIVEKYQAQEDNQKMNMIVKDGLNFRD